MIIPCEVTIWYLLPTIKAELAKELVKRGLTQKEVAIKMDVTQASISQYIRDKRGSRTKSIEVIKEDISALADCFMDEDPPDDCISKKLCMICMKSKSTGLLCELHRDVQEVDDGCDTCIKIGRSYCQNQV